MKQQVINIADLRTMKDGWAERVTPYDNNPNWEEHKQRYHWAKNYAYGKVIDFACGTGYGSAILAESNEVKSVLSIDASDIAIQFASGMFRNEKIQFKKENLQEYQIDTMVDCIVAFECLDHIFTDPVEKIQELFKLSHRVIFSAAIQHPCIFHVAQWNFSDIDAIKEEYKILGEFTQRNGHIINLAIEKYDH